ncbi:hypothetical protein A2U01_0066457, partial [Trifolium medium]|nr:hypothetical protein [Trifolium medium]
DVDASAKASETLGLVKPRSAEDFGKSDVNPTVGETTVGETTVAEASTKVDVNHTVDPVQEVVSETHAEQDVAPSGQTSDKPEDVPNAPASVMPENLENVIPETPEDVPA